MAPPDDNPDAVAKAEVEESPTKAAADDEGLLEKDEPIEIPELEINRLAQKEAAAPAAPEQAKPVDPPPPEVVQQIEDRITQTPAERMDAAFMRELYQVDPRAAEVVGDFMAQPDLAEKSEKMAQVRKTMDLQVWKEILKQRGIEVEITNQGKSNGVRSDLDYTLYYLAEEAGVSIKDLIDEHGKTWQSLHQLTPGQLEIKVMNGDEFYPDWRNEALSEAEHQVRVRRILGELRADPEKYSVPGANKQQVHNRALRDGRTEVLRYDPLLEQAGASIERQLIRAQGPTREIALRYKGVHPQYNHMNAMGNVVQNTRELLHHSRDNAQEAIRRAKYFNRFVNEGLRSLRFFGSYYQLFTSNRPDREKLKRDYLEQAFELLRDQNGKPLLDDRALQRLREVIDISMQIELDKVRAPGSDYNAKRGDYFKNYRAKAEAAIAEQIQGQEIPPVERERLVLAEQQRLFELDQKRVLADGLIVGLRHSVVRDLTPDGALRNRVRFDPATQKFVLDDPEAAKKVAFERASEVALFYELVNSLDDSDPAEKSMKRDIKKTALASAPNTELAEFYRALDEVGKAEIDRFVAGEPGNPVQRNIDEVMRNQQARVLELLLERKKAAVERARSKGVAADPNAVSAAEVRDHILSARLELLSPARRAQFRAAYEALGRLPFGEHLNFRESFYNIASALMLGSSAVNLTRAWQGCDGLPADRCRSLLLHATWSEAINYMPNMVQLWVTPLDVLGKVRKGEYGAALHQGTLVTALALWPSPGPSCSATTS